MSFTESCRRCPRLARHLDRVRRDHPGYHARPVAPFGQARARLLVVGLAPGLHGANRTGRPFTGDYAGILLYDTLCRFGFASRPQSILALGVIAHGAVLMALGVRRGANPFRHGARHALPRGLALFDSYHCSRYNTQTRRLTPEMFRAVVAAIAVHLTCPASTSTSPARSRAGRSRK